MDSIHNINGIIQSSKVQVNESEDILSLLVKMDEKAGKHRKEAEGILSGKMSAYEAFKSGCERAISSFIKLGQEGHVTKKVIKTKASKSQATLDAEVLIKALLKDYDSLNFIEYRQRYFAIYQGRSYDMQKILSDVNFNQISLTKKELSAYKALLSDKKLSQSVHLNSKKANKPPYDLLSYAEKAAINIYTGSGYMGMNALLRGDIKGAIDDYDTPLPFNQKEIKNLALKETLLHVTLAVAGLNKLPNFTPAPNSDGSIPKYVYRAEGTIPKNVMQARKEAVAEGGKALWEMGFLSTAHTKPAAGFLYSAQVGVMIKNIKGKNIGGLSCFPGEREILFPPTQMQWLYHKEIVTNIFLNTKMDLFIAKPIKVNHKVVVIDDELAKKAWLARIQSVASCHLFHA